MKIMFYFIQTKSNFTTTKLIINEMEQAPLDDPYNKIFKLLIVLNHF